MKRLLIGISCLAVISVLMIFAPRSRNVSANAQNLDPSTHWGAGPRPLSVHGLPDNAQDVETLVRARYTMNREAGDAFIDLMKHSEKVEVSSVGETKQPTVNLIVTTDVDSQKLIALLLRSVFPTPNVDLKDIEKSVSADNAPNRVSLRLPGMI